MPNGKTWPVALDDLMPTDMCTRELANYFGLKRKTMETYLARYGFLPDIDYRREKTRYDWDAVDWNKSDSIIARELGADRTTVYKARKRRE